MESFMFLPTMQTVGLLSVFAKRVNEWIKSPKEYQNTCIYVKNVFIFALFYFKNSRKPD